MKEFVIKELNFPQYKFRGTLIGKIADGNKSAFIRVIDPGYWDIRKGDHSVGLVDAAKLNGLKTMDETSSFVLFLLI